MGNEMMLTPDSAAAAVNVLCAAHKRIIDDPYSKRGADIGTVVRNLFVYAGVADELVEQNCYVQKEHQWRLGFPFCLIGVRGDDVTNTSGRAAARDCEQKGHKRGCLEFQRVLFEHMDKRVKGGLFALTDVEQTKAKVVA